LLRLQNDVGGFALGRAGEPSDLFSTAIALKVLVGQDDAAQLASQWVAARLQNTWFDESKRSARAVAFETLALLHKVDISGLRYFAEKSGAKDLTPDTMAIIARALLLAGDEGAAKGWFEKASQAAGQKDFAASAQLFWPTMSRLVTNDQASFDDVEKRQPQTISNEPYLNRVQKLKAFWEMNQKAGSWRTQKGNVEDKHFGVWVLKFSGKLDDASLAFKNISARKLFVTQSSAP
ncbi:MAG: hypothetical protein PHD48_12350, partial [Alphaproteobacteria bacterium]|nr:hypothetical protein [Alphaproteobacteria bacterium]